VAGQRTSGGLQTGEDRTDWLKVAGQKVAGQTKQPPMKKRQRRKWGLFRLSHIVHEEILDNSSTLSALDSSNVPNKRID
jgi:hypothetical protein